MRFLLALLAGACGGVAASYGDLPLWAETVRLHHAVNVGDADYLGEVLGCTLSENQEAGRSMQCGETFLYLSPGGATDLALGAIANVQVEGYAREARARTGTVGTIGGGRIDRGLLYEGSCYGDTGQCVILRGQGWEFRAVEGRLELVGPDGSLRDVWR